MFYSIVFSTQKALLAAAKLPGVHSVHTPLQMIIFEGSVPSKLDPRTVIYISEPYGIITEAKTGLAIFTAATDKFLDLVNYLKKSGVAVLDTFPETNIIITQIPRMMTWTSFTAKLNKEAALLIDTVLEDLTLEVTLDSPDYPYTNYNYDQHGWLNSINAGPSFSIISALSGERHVAIFDSAFDVNHPDLVGRSAFNWNCVNNNSNVDAVVGDQYYNSSLGQMDLAYPQHATAIAGIVAANSTNGILVQSHTLNKVKAQVLKVLYPYQVNVPTPILLYNTTNAALIRAFNRAVLNSSCAAISISWSGGILSSQVINVMNYVLNSARNCNGIPIFASAGNSASDNLTYFPSNYWQTTKISVINGTCCGTVDREDSLLAEFSNFGAGILIGAPAVQVLTTDVSGTYGYSYGSDPNVNAITYYNGTSASAPIVAGVAALMNLVNSSLSVTDVRTILANSALQVNSTGDGGDYEYSSVPGLFDIGGIKSGELGYGLLDQYAALIGAAAFVPGSGGSDLSFDSITIPLTIYAGDTVTVNFTVNIDPGFIPQTIGCSSNSIKLAFYSSATPYYTTANCPLVYETTIVPETGDTTVSGLFSYTVPCNATGSIYIIGNVDYAELYHEPDETNNLDVSNDMLITGTLENCQVTDLSVSITSSSLLTNGYRSFVVKFTNTGDTNITTFNWTRGWLNSPTASQTTSTYNFPASTPLLPGTSRNVNVTWAQYAASFPATWFARINTVNGALDADITNNTSTIQVNQ